LRAACILIFAIAAAHGQKLSPAREAELAGDFPAAEKAYERELQSHPSADLWERLGLTRHLQSKFDTAIPAFREALRLNPSLWTSRVFLGICLYRVNLFEQARSELERAEREVPLNELGRDEIDYWLGASLIALRRPLAGLTVIEGLLARKPSRLDALELAVQTYTDLGSSLWNQVAERSFESAAGYEVHGHALEAEGNVQQALEAYRHSKALEPRRIGPGTAIGRLLLSQGKPADARLVLNDELKLVPADPQACYYAGLAAVQLGETAEAARLLEIADRWTTHDPEPAIALAQVYLALGKREAAAAAARKALTLAPASSAARDLVKALEQVK
jgi:tetratricopeptide (TPR) repeat protein